MGLFARHSGMIHVKAGKVLAPSAEKGGACSLPRHRGGCVSAVIAGTTHRNRVVRSSPDLHRSHRNSGTFASLWARLSA